MRPARLELAAFCSDKIVAVPSGRIELPSAATAKFNVHLGGIEPSSPVPKTGTLSVELQMQILRSLTATFSVPPSVGAFG